MTEPIAKPTPAERRRINVREYERAVIEAGGRRITLLLPPEAAAHLRELTATGRPATEIVAEGLRALISRAKRAQK